MATHDVSLNTTKPIPVGNVDIEDGRYSGRRRPRRTSGA
jgi:hypothetical protein